MTPESIFYGYVSHEHREAASPCHGQVAGEGTVPGGMPVILPKVLPSAKIVPSGGDTCDPIGTSHVQSMTVNGKKTPVVLSFCSGELFLLLSNLADSRKY